MKILWSLIWMHLETEKYLYKQYFPSQHIWALDCFKNGWCTVRSSQRILAYTVLFIKKWVCRLLVATCRQRSSSLKGRAGGGRAQRMLPPVAAPHCGICSRPFRLLTWRHKLVPGAGLLCFTRRFRGAKQPSSESGSRGWETDPAWLWHLFVGHNLRGKSLLSTVVRSDFFFFFTTEVWTREQQVCVSVDMRPAEEWEQRRGPGGPSSGSAAVESGCSLSCGLVRSSRHQVRHIPADNTHLI